MELYLWRRIYGGVEGVSVTHLFAYLQGRICVGESMEVYLSGRICECVSIKLYLWRRINGKVTMRAYQWKSIYVDVSMEKYLWRRIYEGIVIGRIYGCGSKEAYLQRRI